MCMLACSVLMFSRSMLPVALNKKVPHARNCDIELRERQIQRQAVEVSDRRTKKNEGCGNERATRTAAICIFSFTPNVAVNLSRKKGHSTAPRMNKFHSNELMDRKKIADGRVSSRNQPSQSRVPW